MKTPLNIELPENKILRLCEMISGDVVFAIDERASKHGKPKEVLVGVIPKERRQLIAQFINL